MQILVIHNTKNTHGVNDAGGAFIPEAINFNKYRTSLGDKVQVCGYDNLLPQAERTKAVFKLIKDATPFDAFVYLGHGLRNSLSSANITQAKRPEFTKLLASKAATKNLFVTLYACSTAETTVKGAEDGEGGFADKVRDDLVALGFTGWVDGHTVPGHATQNSLLRRFVMDPNDTMGGDFLVVPKSAEFAQWKAKLNSKWRDDPFRFQFPYMTQADILKVCAPKK